MTAKPPKRITLEVIPDAPVSSGIVLAVTFPLPITGTLTTRRVHVSDAEDVAAVRAKRGRKVLAP